MSSSHLSHPVFRRRCALLASGLFFFLLTAVGALAQINTKIRGGEGAAQVVLNYRCDPANRATFRTHMETTGVDQFESWKKSGVFSDYLILFSTFSSSRTFDMWVILYFDRFADIGKWYEIEKKFPGGLTPEGHKLARPDGTVYTDIPWDSASRRKDLSKSVFMIIPYKSLVSVNAYADYSEKYVIPQLKGWVRSGILPSYEIHQNTNPTNAPWDILMVFEYDGLRGIALRDQVKMDVRKEIGHDPDYKRYAEIKTTLRKEDEPTTFLPILPRK
jgi:hypothetical protein